MSFKPKIIEGNPNAPRTVRDVLKPCPHGYTMAGNCVICNPPPKYTPMRGPKTGG